MMSNWAGDATRRQNALTALHATDLGTLERVAAARRGQLDGQVIPATAVLVGPAELLEHRTCTLLDPVYAKGRQ
jgi:hypothetical protein